MGRSCYKKMKLSQKYFLMGKFITQDQVENQQKDGRMLSGGKHHGSYKYKDGGEQQDHRDEWRPLLRGPGQRKG